MSSFNELMQKYVNTDYEDLKSLAQQALVNLMPKFKLVDTEHDGLMMATAVILSAVSADGKLTALEKRFLGDMLSMDDETITKMISLYTGKEAALTDKFADAMDANTKADIIMLVTCFAAVDEKISREETAFIRKLFE